MLDQAYLLAYGRRPTAAERARSLDFLISQERVYCADGRPPAQAETAAWTDLAHTLLASNEFLYVD
jgi:hypothetical protein